MTIPFNAFTPPPAPAPLDLTPAPALLRALADVGEVDLATGLGRRRLAEVVRRAGPLDRPRSALRRWLSLAWLLAASVCLLLLAIG